MKSPSLQQRELFQRYFGEFFKRAAIAAGQDLDAVMVELVRKYDVPAGADDMMTVEHVGGGL